MENKLKKRLQKPLKQWVKAVFWCLIYVLFIAWVGNFWWLFLLPFIFDAYVTRFIPWDFWKNTKNKMLYSIFSWIDAIVFALVAVYFINLYLFQNYKIPSSSLEKTLLIGDHLFVSKMSYGPRIPNTPLSFPLMQHTIPFFNCKSYIEHPQWEYRRLKGFGSVERGDIVVFNFPAGDSVALNIQNPDYYTLCYYKGKENVHRQTNYFGEIVYRPVDRRENYVKRCVALPGDTFQLIDNQVYINGNLTEEYENVQHNYFVQTSGTILSRTYLEELGISADDRVFLNLQQNVSEELLSIGLDEKLPTYHLPLTKKMKEKLSKNPSVKSIVVEPSFFGGEVYPLGKNNWSRDSYGPIYMPRKGETLKITPENYAVYERVIRNYERNSISMKNGEVYINGEKTDTYTFKMDYYWMMGDNRHKSSDSRYWGLVPEDHIVGRPLFVWLSLDKDKSLFNGKIRWERFFKSAK